MLYVFKMILVFEKGWFFVFGCVFVGKVFMGLKVCIMGVNYMLG